MTHPIYSKSVADATNFIEYAEKHELALLKLHIGSKRPVGDAWQNLFSTDPIEWAQWKTLSFNHGVHARMSRLVIVDLDVADGKRGAEQWAAWCRANGMSADDYPAHVTSARGGQHIYFRIPDGLTVRGANEPIQDVDIIVNGQTVAPGSYFDGTSEGKQSGWYTMLSDAPPHTMPAALIALCTRKPRKVDGALPAGTHDASDTAALLTWMAEREMFADYADWIAAGMALKTSFGPDGESLWDLTHDGSVSPSEAASKWGSFNGSEVTLLSLLKRAKDAGWPGTVRPSTSSMFQGVAEIAAAAAPPLASAAQGVSLMTGGDAIPADTEDSLALGFAELHVDELRYVQDTGQWLGWDGTRWRPDRTSRAYDMVRKHIRTFANSINFAERRKIANAKTTAAVEHMARKDPRIVTEAAIWDADIWLLNTPSGTVDLQTGILQSACPSDHMTKITAVGPGGECPTWLAFLHRAMNGDAELIAFLQRALGYALCGSTRDHAFFFLHGPGGNGKGVFLNTIAGILGDYSTTAPIETFLASQFERHPTDVAALAGARLAVSDEIPPGRYWDEAKLNRLTGGDTIRARFMRQDGFEFVPQFKLVLVGNNRPRLHTVNEAIRRRLNLIPFTVKIPPAERDATLPERLKAEWPGILAWLIQGCLEWQQNGLRPPPAVQAATAEYIDGEDVLATWLEERCDRAPGAWASRQDLFVSWSGWANSAREVVGTQKQFYQLMRNHEFEEGGGPNGSRGFKGVKVNPLPVWAGTVVAPMAPLPPLPY